MEKLKTYTVTVLQGTLGDYETEWWTEEDWERHRKYIANLTKRGDYLKPIEVQLTVKQDSVLDYPMTSKECESYEFVLLDLSK